MRTLEQVIADLSLARQEVIESRAAELIAEESSLRYDRAYLKAWKHSITQGLNMGKLEVASKSDKARVRETASLHWKKEGEIT